MIGDFEMVGSGWNEYRNLCFVAAGGWKFAG